VLQVNRLIRTRLSSNNNGGAGYIPSTINF